MELGCDALSSSLIGAWGGRSVGNVDNVGWCDVVGCGDFGVGAPHLQAPPPLLASPAEGDNVAEPKPHVLLSGREEGKWRESGENG